MDTFNLKPPVKNLQSCWEDDKRMTALYAPFRLRQANPVDYDSKMKFWENGIENWCLEKNICVFSISRLKEEFKRQNRVPLCLNTVVNTLERTGQVKLKDEFLKMIPEESWTVWALKYFVEKPVLWSFHKLKMALIESDTEENEYVCINYLKKRCAELVMRLEESNNDLYSHAELHKILISISETDLTDETFDIVLLWLQLNQVVQIKKLEGDILIKFIGGKKNNSLTEIDVSLFMLKKNKLAIEKAIEALEVEKDEIFQTAKNFLKKGMRESAKSYLRRKKAIEKSLEKRISASENIDLLISRIHEASSDSNVLETYKIGLNALKATFKESGLPEEITNTITEIQEINELHDEIQSALSEPITSHSDIELDEELKSILATASDSEKEIVLPNAPCHEPINSSEEKKISELVNL